LKREVRTAVGVLKKEDRGADVPSLSEKKLRTGVKWLCVRSKGGGVVKSPRRGREEKTGKGAFRDPKRMKGGGFPGRRTSYERKKRRVVVRFISQDKIKILGEEEKEKSRGDTWEEKGKARPPGICLGVCKKKGKFERKALFSIVLGKGMEM